MAPNQATKCKILSNKKGERRVLSNSQPLNSGKYFGYWACYTEPSLYQPFKLPFILSSRIGCLIQRAKKIRYLIQFTLESPKMNKFTNS